MDILNTKPKIKKAYPTVTMDDAVYIGGFGTITEYKDPSGAVRNLIESMDGTRTANEISENISKNFPDFKKEEVLAAIDEISKEGFLEDMNLIGSSVLTEYELTRYHRNINFFSSYVTLSENKYKLQKKIIDSKIGIIGLGGLGSHIVYNLAGLGVGNIKAVEFDTVDISNLNRQILYNFKDIGESKAKLAENRIKEFNPETHFFAVEKKIKSAQDIIDTFEGYDLLILVADRPKVKLARWVNEAIIKMNIPLFCAGLEAQRALQYTIIPGQTGCIDCWRKSVEDDNPVSHALLEERRKRNLVGDNTAIIPLVSVVTGIVCSEILKYITGIGELTTVGNLKSIDMNTMTTAIVETWAKNEDCESCGALH